MKIQQGVVIAASVLILSFGLSHFASTAESTATIEMRLKKLEDNESIRALLVAYGRALDKRDFKAYGALFARDGSWKGGMGTAIGPDAIAKMVEAGFGRMSPSLYESSNHVMSSHAVDINGDSATAWSRWTWVVVGANGKPQTERAGHYEDTLVREDGKWKFKSRQAFTEINP
jgi:uncharacterized protein (TIGR02246 family)